MNDITNLYQEYLKIQKIIKSSYNIEEYDDDTKAWLESHYKRTFNGYVKVYLPISTIRNICQDWIDKIIAENKISRFSKGWIDLLFFGIKGKFKERKKFLSMFYAIYYDMASKLDLLDGGPDTEVKTTTTGFAIG